MNKMNFYNSQRSEWQFKLLNHIKQYGYWYLLFAAMCLALFVYYWFEWRTFQGFVIAIDHNPEFMKDFKAYYYAMGRQMLQAPIPVNNYYYTSFFAILLTPIGMLQLYPAMLAWIIVQIGCLIILYFSSAWNLFKLSADKMVLYAGLWATCFPILHNIKWGQVSLILTTCIIIAFVLYNKYDILSGIILAFATAIKYYPVLFIIYFIMKRNIRACIAFGIAMFIFYFAFPATLLGFSGWLNFEKTTSSAINNATWVYADVNSQNIVSVGSRWFLSIFGPDTGNTLTQILPIAGYIIAFSCILIAWILQRRALCEKFRLPMVAIFLSFPFLIKTSWPHYFVYLPVCQTAVLLYCASAYKTSGIRGKMHFLLPVSSIVMSNIFLFNLFPNWMTYSSYGMLFLANLLLLVALFIIAGKEINYSAIYETISKIFQRLLMKQRQIKQYHQ